MEEAEEAGILDGVFSFGPISLMSWMVDYFGITKEQADSFSLFLIAGESGNPELVKWTVESELAGGSWDEVFGAAVSTGSVPVAQYLRDQMDLPRDYLRSDEADGDLLRDAFMSGSREMLAWVFANFDVTISDAFSAWGADLHQAIEDAVDELVDEAPDEFRNVDFAKEALREIIRAGVSFGKADAGSRRAASDENTSSQ